jgi:anti-sigma factor RsiW
MMKCKFDRSKLILYLFNEVTSAEREEISAHIESCEVCALELEQLSSVRSRWPNQPIADPPSLHIVKTPARQKLVRQPRRARRVRRLIPALGFAIVLAIIAFSLIWRLAINKRSNYWSIENSWEGPYRYHFEAIDRTIDRIQNDKFFNQ